MRALLAGTASQSSAVCGRAAAALLRGRAIAEHRAAMKGGWDGKARRFRCKRTDGRLNHWNPENPNFMVFDHPDPDE